MRSITIVLGQFDALVSHGLTQILHNNKDIRIVGGNLGGAALERFIAQRTPNVAIIDEASITGSSLLRRVKAIQPEVGVVVLADRPSRAWGMRLLGTGVTCLSKDACVADILAAVHLAAEGKHTLAYQADRHIGRGDPVRIKSLTVREAEVFERLSLAWSYGQVAHDLGISIETVRTHAAQIRRKFGVRSKLELVGLNVPRREGEGIT